MPDLLVCSHIYNIVKSYLKKYQHGILILRKWLFYLAHVPLAACVGIRVRVLRCCLAQQKFSRNVNFVEVETAVILIEDYVGNVQQSFNCGWDFNYD